MLDKPEKTRELLATLNAATPFEIELTEPLIAHLRAQPSPVVAAARQSVSQVLYLGDEGGVVCRLEPEDGENALVISLTHLRVPRSLPFATAVLDYQKHRVKKLKKQNAT